MQFASDNWAGAAPEVVEAIAREAARAAAAYGDSAIDKAVEKRFAEIFEREVAVFFVATGSAANGLAMAAVNKPGGVIFAHRDAHMIEGECGGVEYLTAGARLFGLDGDDGRIDAAALKCAIASVTPASEHHGQAMAVSITQQTEAGTAYSLDQIGAIAEIAKANDLPLHMDGARFANALVRSNATAAEMTWKAGVDILSFGATKNGCVAAEAIVFFDPSQARDMPFLRKRAGQLFSKSRFVAAQFDAYLRDGLWLRLARHANEMADRLRAGISRAAHAREVWATSGNEIFVAVRTPDAKRLAGEGAIFHEWTRTIGVRLEAGETLLRLVTSFATTADEVDLFLKKLG
jgi:threonine aldolase